jgi:hypothetical protein
MKNTFLSIAAVTALALGAASARADSPLYGFENGDAPNNLDGFANNGGGITVTHDTIGATGGSAGSMKNVSVSGAGFTGALTGSTPAGLTEAGVTAIQFDYTVNPGETFTGAFADIGITIFGAIGGSFGNQYQVDASSERNIALAPGTYHLTVPLIGTSPVDFSLHQPFSAVLAQGFIPTGFEFFYSKSGDSAVTGYIDNVATVTPEPTSLVVLGIAGSLLAGSRRRRA